MANEELRKKIDESGLKMIYIADQLGIHRVTLRDKLLGKTEFTVSEAGKLADILKLNRVEKDDIFFKR